ncbi:hypothetical protein F3Y22_tig00110584pilonHSYRG00394 [Hibiscus syriacus]|uniref:Uncharacterized protein n=1 Tax=Hibiscus syriacus TaxID=106335 RepID=A0A6A3A4N3_HIBSY|nr:hypothetical protein F3Y22_tig00110584pilonHSYRG00394 [Hibiscus syriacus]
MMLKVPVSRKIEQVRVRAAYAANDCGWVILASRQSNDDSFRVKTYFPQHSCLSTTYNEMPKKKRRNGFEGAKKMTMSRVESILSCSFCHKEGHKRARYPMMPDVQ